MMPVQYQFNELLMTHFQNSQGQVVFAAAVNPREYQGSWAFGVSEPAPTVYGSTQGDLTAFRTETDSLPCCTIDVQTNLIYTCVLGVKNDSQVTIANVTSNDVALSTIYGGLEARNFSVLPDARGWAFHFNQAFVPDPLFTDCSSMIQVLEYRNFFFDLSECRCSYGYNLDGQVWSHGTNGTWLNVTGQSLDANVLVVEIPRSALPNAFYLTHPRVVFQPGHQSTYFSKLHFEEVDTDALRVFKQATYDFDINVSILRPNCIDEFIATVYDFKHTYGEPLEERNFTVECANIGNDSNTAAFTQWLQEGINSNQTELRRSLDTLPPSISWRRGSCKLRFSAVNWIQRDWREYEQVAGNARIDLPSLIYLEYESTLHGLELHIPSQHRRRHDLVLGATALERHCGEPELLPAPADKYSVMYTLPNHLGSSFFWEGAQAVIPRGLLPKLEGPLSVRVEARGPGAIYSTSVSVEILLDPIVAVVAGGELRVLPNPHVELEADFAEYSYDPN
ncbi:MAG: hypothetical protein MHM6MM_008481, partial [Cercozoa sp. M6MM]